MWRFPAFFLLILALVCPAALPEPAWAGPRPACAGPVAIAGARVVRVEQNGVLVLADGRVVVLEGIRMPMPRPGQPGDREAAEVLSTLHDLTVERTVTFTAVPPKEGRYGRLRVQAFVGDVWLQAALLERGLARVAISPDRSECATALLAAEARGRGGKAGIWAGGPASPYRVREPRQLRGTAGTFQVVEGRVANVGRASSGRAFIDFGTDWPQGFSATVAPADRRRFRGLDLNRLVAHRVRVRGIVQDYRGRPEIALSNPAQIEILD
jgi:endonuclease YncB( thermonuclease family)